jgi:hypothetical protein
VFLAVDVGVVFFLLLAACTGALMLVGLAVEKRRVSGLRTLRDCLHYAFLEGADQDKGVVTASFRGQPVRVSVTSDSPSGGWIRLALKLPGRAYSQALPSPGAALSEQLGAQAGAALGALRHLARFAQQGTLEVEDGWLVLRRHRTDYLLSPQSLEATLAALSGLAPLLARTELDLVVSPREGQPHVEEASDAAPSLSGEAAPVALAWREAEGGEVLCPYCRDGLQVEALELARCEDCHTVHHAECLEEAGRCSIFGCGGERRQRVALRPSG